MDSGEELVLKMRAVGAGTTAGEIDKVTASTKRANKAAAESTGVLDTAGKSWQSFGSKLKAVGGRLKSAGSAITHGLTVPILAVGALAAKFSLDFNRQMQLIETSAGAPVGEVNRLRKGVLALAGVLPQSPTELAKGLFHIESVGLRGAKALDALKIAAKGAAVGNADLEETTSALGAAWLVDIKGAGSLKNVMANMVATAGAGNMRLGELVEGYGTGILPVAKSVGLGLTDINGALALLADEGQHVDTASARLSVAFSFLATPNKKATKSLEAIGMTGDQMAIDLRKPKGLLVALRDLHQHLDGLPGGAKGIRAQDVLADIFPNGRGRVMRVLMNQMDRYDMKMNQITHTTGRFDDSVNKTLRNPKVRMEKAWSSIQKSLIVLGGSLVPLLVPMFVSLAHYVSLAAAWFDKLSPRTKKFVVIALAVVAVLGPLLVMLGTMVLMIEALMSPVTLVVIALALLVIGAIYAYTHFKTFHDVADQLGHVLVGIFGWVRQHWKLVAALLVGPIYFATVYILLHFNTIESFITGFPTRMKKKAAGMWDWLKDGLVPIINSIIHQLNRIHFSIPSWVPGVGGKSWGINIKPIPVAAHPQPAFGSRGSVVGQPMGHGEGDPGVQIGAPALAPIEVHTHVHIDKKEVAKAVTRHYREARALS